MISPPGLSCRRSNLSRDSVLTFAAIYYPDTGMQSFEADSLGALTDYERADESSVSHEDFITRRNLNPKERRPPRPANPEPFAVLGGRQRHFIGICSSKVYEKYLKGLVPFRKCSEDSDSESNYSTEEEDVGSYATIPIGSVLFSDFEGTETKVFYQLSNEDAPQHPVSVPITPSATSAFNFGAPRAHKISESQDPNFLCTPEPFKPKSGDSDIFVTPKADLQEIQEILYFPPARTPNTYRDAIPSSTLNGLKGRWDGLPYYEDDEGFYETVKPRKEGGCGNLPSRFSVTTTSTSRYVEVDEGIMPSPGPTAVFLGRKPVSIPAKPSFLSQCPRLRKESLTQNQPPSSLKNPLCESKENQTLQTRLSQVFRQRLTKKRPENIAARWILVDVECVVTERVSDL